MGLFGRDKRERQRSDDSAESQDGSFEGFLLESLFDSAELPSPEEDSQVGMPFLFDSGTFPLDSGADESHFDIPLLIDMEDSGEFLLVNGEHPDADESHFGISLLADLFPEEPSTSQAFTHLSPEMQNASSVNLTFGDLPFCVSLHRTTSDRIEISLSDRYERVIWKDTLGFSSHGTFENAPLIFHDAGWRVAISLTDSMKFRFDRSGITRFLPKFLSPSTHHSLLISSGRRNGKHREVFVTVDSAEQRIQL